MSEASVREEFTKNFICDRATYQQMRMDQKEMVHEIRNHWLRDRYDLVLDKWWKEKPRSTPDNRFPDQTTWRRNKPTEPWVLTQSLLPKTRRAMSLVYGIVKGNTYEEMERKHRDGNQPSRHHVQMCCAYYGIDPNPVLEAIYGCP